MVIDNFKVKNNTATEEWIEKKSEEWVKKSTYSEKEVGIKYDEEYVKEEGKQPRKKITLKDLLS